ncbi:hypothetical protein P167DRAFT_569074 [Morchella conica CCBAS932]|uniref:Uncharacterized protein n=1 Tax=Morchella conica CCBAS932 TaxID=1392247 RepID=A0A3N4KB59_9PEZI|nr:hypothetical protein P167DRAFT_569074 [Morchella conica CCBAS932]
MDDLSGRMERATAAWSRIALLRSNPSYLSRPPQQPLSVNAPHSRIKTTRPLIKRSRTQPAINTKYFTTKLTVYQTCLTRPPNLPERPLNLPGRLTCPAAQPAPQRNLAPSATCTRNPPTLGPRFSTRERWRASRPGPGTQYWRRV